MGGISKPRWSPSCRSSRARSRSFSWTRPTSWESVTRTASGPFARASGLPYGQGLVKNRYIGRTFIAPSQAARAQAVRMKLNPLRENVAGKRLVVVDDSIVRGTTQLAVVKMLREAGAAEVHLRI